MGKAKTQRTEALHQAARRYVLAKQAEQAIAQHSFDKFIQQGLVVAEHEQHHFDKLVRTGLVVAKQARQAIAQHNLDKLVAQGVIMTEPTGNPEPRRLTMKDLMDAKRYLDREQDIQGGGLQERLDPPRGRHRL